MAILSRDRKGAEAVTYLIAFACCERRGGAGLLACRWRLAFQWGRPPGLRGSPWTRSSEARLGRPPGLPRGASPARHGPAAVRAGQRSSIGSIGSVTGGLLAPMFTPWWKGMRGRCPNRLNPEEGGRKRWARHGSTRWLWKSEHVSAALHYVVDEQGEPMALFQAPVP